MDIDDSSSDMGDLDSSTTIMSTIDENEWLESLSFEDMIEIENMTYEFIGDYIHNEIHTMSSPHFHDNLKHSVFLLIEEQLLESQIYSKKNEEELENFIDQLCDEFFITHNNIPPRSYRIEPNVSILNQEERTRIETQIKKLENRVQPKQKSEEWYKLRNEILTASNIWKVFASEAQQNSLIYEKCSQTKEYYQNTNVNSTLHWGNKYEPLSAMIYEYLTKSKIQEFGCIIHEKYPFIGASPDGIVVSCKAQIDDIDRYGRMIEIKNIVNREITGIPKEEYWIQMQIQMETCDLEKCDFVETRFKEFVNEEAFYSNTSHSRGVILYFTDKYNIPHYEYINLHEVLDKENINQWIEKKEKELKKDYSLIEVQYWYLDEMSVVMVQRNREWFQSVIPKIEQFWKTIEKERVEGFEHRNVKKRLIKPDIVEVTNDETSTNKIIHNMQNHNNICLIKLDENDI
jgi:putative phage-type endonuclease